MPRSVVLVTPAVGQGGGIASVAKIFIDTWPASSSTLQVVETGAPAPFRFVRALARLAYLMTTRRAGVLWIMVASRGSTVRKSIVMLMAIATRTPFVVHVHGGGFVEFYGGLPRPAVRTIRWIFRRADRIVALSECQAARLGEALGVASIDVLPNAVTDFHVPKSSRPPGELRVIFIGNATQEKGFCDLLAALPDGASLTVVGRASEEAQKRAESAGVRVEFLGWRDDVPLLIASHDVLALPSYIENMPMVVLEAFAVGVPVVTSNVGALPEMVTEDVGVLCEVGNRSDLRNALESMRDSGTRLAMAAAARRRWELRYDARRYGARVAALLGSDGYGTR